MIALWHRLQADFVNVARDLHRDLTDAARDFVADVKAAFR